MCLRLIIRIFIIIDGDISEVRSIRILKKV